MALLVLGWGTGTQSVPTRRCQLTLKGWLGPAIQRRCWLGRQAGGPRSPGCTRHRASSNGPASHLFARCLPGPDLILDLRV